MRVGLTDSHCHQFFLDAKSFSQGFSLMPDQYINKVASRLDIATGGRVFCVTSPAGLKGRKARGQSFGQLEVVIYRVRPHERYFQEWREDLLLRTAGRVAAPFRNDYQLLSLIEELLPSGESPDHWRCLADR